MGPNRALPLYIAAGLIRNPSGTVFAMIIPNGVKF